MKKPVPPAMLALMILLAVPALAAVALAGIALITTLLIVASQLGGTIGFFLGIVFSAFLILWFTIAIMSKYG